MPLLQSLSSGVSALQQFQQQLDVIGNNIANVATTGYKGADVEFADALSQTMQGAGATGSMQVGTGVNTASIANRFTQGAINATGKPTDLAISGSGFFVVRNPVTNQEFATRAGDFTVDTDGYLVSNGLRVQGYSDTGLSTIGDIKVDANGGTAAVESWHFDTDGKITVQLSDATPPFTRGQVLLQNFQSPQVLVKEGDSLYSGMANAGPLAQLSAPSTNGMGKLEVGALEGSNVDLTTELSNLITTQRAFEANSKVITTSDEVLQALVNIKR
ncbi:MAG TPA: flagellar hook-basal body complex protein [Patescibacteria group bacterium]|jgi:flagellar hook protein FlgE|nr:flagellar hook-basal body complex protein [Patescibacteria group bacterium]